MFGDVGCILLPCHFVKQTISLRARRHQPCVIADDQHRARLCQSTEEPRSVVTRNTKAVRRSNDNAVVMAHHFQQIATGFKLIAGATRPRLAALNLILHDRTVLGVHVNTEGAQNIALFRYRWPTRPLQHVAPCRQCSYLRRIRLLTRIILRCKNIISQGEIDMTIYEKLRRRLNREPTNAELKAEVARIKSEALIDAAEAGKLRHQRKSQ